MRLFISWSGERSNQLAIALRDWLPLVLHYADPWLSDSDIQAGDRWAQSVAKELATTNFGIACITPENINAPWMLFEAGALAKSLEVSKVIPLLFGLEFSDVSGPLAQFQSKKLTRDGMLEIVQSLQKIADSPVPENQAKQLFDALWPNLESRISKIPANAPTLRQTRPEGEVLEELVASVRAIDGRIRQPDEYPDFPGRRFGKHPPRIHHAALDELAERISMSPVDPTRLLVYATPLREVPWIYELVLDAYRAITSKPRQGTRLNFIIPRLLRAIDVSMSPLVIEEFGINPRDLDFLGYSIRQFLDRYQSQTGSTPSLAIGEKQIRHSDDLS